MLRSRRIGLAIALAVLSTACAEPPAKEMHQAQGAIDSARAAGAAEYAPASLEAAETALARATTAASQRDFRQALSLALDSREQALAAVRQAGDARAAARADAERRLVEIGAGTAALESRLEAAAGAGVRVRALEAPRLAVASARTAMQEASAAIAKHEYRQALARLGRVPDALKLAGAQLDAAIASRAGSGARPSRRTR